MSGALLATQWTTPLTQAQRPWIMWADWTDIVQYVDLSTIRISGSSGSTPDTMQFTVRDKGNAIGSYLRENQRLLFIETQANSNAGRIVYHGFTKLIEPDLRGPYADYVVSCVDVSEFLDASLPIEAFVRPAETDRSRIGAVLGNFCTWSSMPCGGFIQSLGSLSKGDFSHATVRGAIEDTLTATGTVPAGYYVDKLGYLHTYSSGDAGAAPFTITDTSPNLTTSIPARLFGVQLDGTAAVDYAYVYGATKAGSGPAGGSSSPVFPARYVAIDQPDSPDSSTRRAIGAMEIAKRRSITRFQAEIIGFDGWEKGQILTVTSTPLGWAARTFVIVGVDTEFLSGTGIRKYVLTVATVPQGRKRMSVQLAGMTMISHKRRAGSAIRGRVGSPSAIRGA